MSRETRRPVLGGRGGGIPPRYSTICAPTTALAPRAPRLADTWIFIIGGARIPALTGARQTRPTSIRRPAWRRHENFPQPGVGCDYGRAIALPASHPTPGVLEQTNPGGTPLIIRGKLFRQPEPALKTHRNPAQIGFTVRLK